LLCDGYSEILLQLRDGPILFLKAHRKIQEQELRSASSHESRLTYRKTLRHKHRETLAGAAGFDEFAHRQFVTAVATVT